MAKYLEKAQLERLWQKIKACVDENVGSGVCDYSLEEQNTGRKWIDGKDIYCRTVAVDGFPSATTETTTSYPHNIPSINEVVDYELRWYDTTDTEYHVNSNVYSSSNYIRITGVTPTHLKLRSRGYSYSSRTTKRYLTVYYTKDDRIVLKSVFAGTNSSQKGTLTIDNAYGSATNPYLDITAINTTSLSSSTSLIWTKADSSKFKVGKYKLTIDLFDSSKDTFYFGMSGSDITLINSDGTESIVTGSWVDSGSGVYTFEFEITSSNVDKLKVMSGGFYINITSYVNGQVGEIYLEMI